MQVLGKDITDYPVTGIMKDENDNDLGVNIAFSNVATIGQSVIVEASPGKRIRVLHYSIALNKNEASYYFSSNNTALCSTKSMSYAADTVSGGYLFQTEIGEELRINLAGAVDVTVGVDVIYVEIIEVGS